MDSRNVRLAMRASAAAVLVVLCMAAIGAAKTRWSSLRMVPDSDLLPGGEFTIGFDGMLGKSVDVTTETSISVAGIDSTNPQAPDTTYDTAVSFDTTGPSMFFSQTYLLKLGVVEWVNVHVGYAGGFTLGFKARILGETDKGMPSLAVGVHNVFHHKEVNYYQYSSSQSINNEFYVALGKSVERIKLRLHVGFQSMPTVEDEVFNPFFAIEKYFGFGLYTSLEVNRRDLSYHGHLFASMRLLDDKLELSAGAVALESMFFDESKNFAISLSPRTPDAWVGPGIWLGARFHARMGLGQKGGFQSVEDRIRKQDQTIGTLKGEVDSLRTELKGAYQAVKQVEGQVVTLGDSAASNRVKQDILVCLEQIKQMYSAEEFDPNSVRDIVARIRRYGDMGVAVLKEILLDESLDRRVRLHSVNVLGTIANKSASDVLLDVLAASGDPDLKIEILIALGKMKETRAMYLMEQLANDPNDAIALTAQEVLRQLSEQTGARISPSLKMREVEEQQESDVIPEEKIRVKEQGGGTENAEKPPSDSKPEAKPQSKPKAPGGAKTQE